MSESELKSIVSKNKESLSSLIDIDVDIISLLVSNAVGLEEYQYAVSWDYPSLNIAQMRQIRLHAPELWIILNGTKIGYSKSLWCLILKLLLLQSYVPFAILHFQAIQCRNGFDREQRCHFKFFQKRIAGEHYLLTVDDVRCIFKPLDDGSDGRVISGNFGSRAPASYAQRPTNLRV